MAAGFMLLGMVAGALSAIAMAVMGYSIWLAFGAYVLGGMSGMGVGMAVTLVPQGLWRALDTTLRARVADRA